MLVPTLIVTPFLIVLLVFLAYIFAVPRDDEPLGSLSTCTDSTACDLLELVYPLQTDVNKFASLSKGKTHFFLKGKADGKRIVLVHGINATGNIFPHAIDALVNRNFLVLSYDLYGMGYSDSPAARYDSETYTTQLKELLDHVGWSKTIVLGNSLGGGISTEFANQYPEMVEKLVLIAPAGLKHSLPAIGKVFAIPILGETLFYLIGRRFLSQRSKKHLKGLIPDPYKSHMVAMQNLNFKHNQGFARCYFKTIQFGPIQNRDSIFQSVASQFGSRVLCIWGRGDTTTDFQVEGARFRKYMPNAQFVELEGRHTIFGERADDVTDIIKEFCAS
ncbi:Alpha/Beta hydrolase protein [Obelidium mucronatum]|nr:Alpha/Beta hydrolase protein [Obelidium mucronatum]